MQRAALGGSTRAIDIFAGLHQQGFVTTMLSHRFSPFNRAEIAFVTAGEMVRNTFWGDNERTVYEEGRRTTACYVP